MIVINNYSIIKRHYLTYIRQLSIVQQSISLFIGFISFIRILIILTTGCWTRRIYYSTIHKAKCYLYFYLLAIITTNSYHYSTVHVIIQFAFFPCQLGNHSLCLHVYHVFSKHRLGSWLKMPVPSNLAILSQGIASPRLIIQS